MNSQFLAKFKGKTNKISKQGINELLDATNNYKKNIKKVQNKQINNKSLDIQNDRQHSMIRVLKQKINHQQMINKMTSVKSVSLVNNNKPYYSKIPNRQITTGKQKQNKIQKIEDIKERQFIRLPKIGKQKLSYHLSYQSRQQSKKQENLIKNKKNNYTQMEQQSYVKFKFCGNFMDDEAHEQLKKLNKFQTMLQQKTNTVYAQEEYTQNRHNHCYKKGLTMHY